MFNGRHLIKIWQLIVDVLSIELTFLSFGCCWNNVHEVCNMFTSWVKGEILIWYMQGQELSKDISIQLLWSINLHK